MQALLADLQRAGVKLKLEGGELRIAAPPGALTDSLKQALRVHRDALVALLHSHATAPEPALPALTPDPASRDQPFPLTDLQHAYWIGRDPTLEMGGVATHLYLELETPGLEPGRLNEALCRLIERHDMLRAVVDADGLQRILPQVPAYRIAVTDCRALDSEAGQAAVEATRAALSHQVLAPDRWPLFDVRTTLLPDGVRLHVSLDLLILDAMSMALLFREWRRWYDEPGWQPEPLRLSFRDYVLAERRQQGSAAHQRARDYWMGRVDSLPAAPELPLRADPAARRSPRFSRREARLPRARWDALQARARQHGITPSCLLLAAYSAVLARWSASAHFTVNVVVSQRQPLHPEVNQLLGDFAAPLLHEVDWREPRQGFLALARRLQARFIDDLAHPQLGGVALLREWARRRHSTGQALMPVVFSSGLIRAGQQEVADLEPFGRTVFSVSQTPQVWLDHHVREVRGDLVYNWDAVDAVFEDGVLDAMFDSYQALIEALTDDDRAWTRAQTVPLPAAMLRRREIEPPTVPALPQACLHAGFVARALTHPDAPALIAGTRSLSYAQLLAESVAVADRLLARGVGAGEPVAVLMHKGWEQVVAVYGVLLAGAAYLPIDAELPTRRQQELLRAGDVAQVLVQAGAEPLPALAGGGLAVHAVAPAGTGLLEPCHLASLEGPLDRLAYLIFTSGTTGVPKGVMIDHRAAVNTVMHVNALIGAGPQDRVLAVSSLSFDLSVHDIFGLHAAGGAVVLPDPGKGHDPAHWRALMETHGVTCWNSAPQLMRMLMDGPPGEGGPAAPLRTVMLSGDFIPLELPGRIRERHPRARVISLGGATEAAIWSICHEVDAVQPGWASIPYGRPLPNQSVWVGDAAFQPCPDHVQGRIYIGGLGLAQGYRGDPALTARRFVRHPDSGERLYDTGDNGRYASEGHIVILGRDDGQVKIRGHRVELGEIEAVLRQHDSVAQAVVRCVGDSSQNRQLVAHVEPVPGHELAPAALKEYLAERLPEYMVPRRLLAVERMPLSANGKLDAGALPLALPDDDAASRIAPRTPAERTIWAVWSRVLDSTEIGVTDQFFELGGDSVIATVLLRELNAVLPFTLEMHELFENLTVEALAGLLESRRDVDGDVESPEDGSFFELKDHAAMDADIEAARRQLQAIERPTAATPTAWRAVFLTGATGWIGSHVLEALLARTEARLCCLVRAASPAEGHARLLEALQRNGIHLAPACLQRIEPVCGDLTAPRFGLEEDTWRRLAQGTDAIYHLAASLNVYHPYAEHRKVNVLPLTDLLRLAAEHHVKPVFAASPMTVCRRRLDGELVVFGREAPSDDPRGLLTGYARSKWTAERILLEAARQHTLPVRVYRSSHALPTARDGLAKPKDTYVSVLRAALAAGLVPQGLDEALFHGLPTELLADLLVADSLACDTEAPAVVHIDNPRPRSLAWVIERLLEGRAPAPSVPEETWMARCRSIVGQMENDEGRLAAALFASMDSGIAVRNMFSPHRIETGALRSIGLDDPTPAPYWQLLRHALAQAAGEGIGTEAQHGRTH